MPFGGVTLAFNVQLYQFQKKTNSTMRPPSGTTSIQLTGEIKTDFTPLNFDMTFRFDTPSDIPQYNYAYISVFSRYYFITDWVFVGGLWRGSFTVDVLATYRTEILASNQFVARCASEKQGGLIDTSYPTISGANRGIWQQTQTQADFWGAGFDDGTVVLGVIGNSGANVGSLTYYAMATAGYNNLMNSLLSDISWANISTSEISANLQKALINPFQYIASVIWLPLNAIAFVTQSGAPASDIVSSIRLGWWNFDISLGGNVARILHNPLSFGWDYVQRKAYFSIEKHSQAAARGEWLNLAPYSKYVFSFLPFGVFEVDTAELQGYEYFGYQVRVHCYTGDAVLTMYAAHDNQGTSDKVLQTVTANVGVPLPVGQVSLNIGNMDSALTSAALMGATEIAQQLSGSPVVTAAKPSAHSKTSRSTR